MNTARTAVGSTVDSLLTEAVAEFLERLARGEEPAIDEYARRYPQIAVELRELLPALRVVGLSPLSNTGRISGAIHLLRHAKIE